VEPLGFGQRLGWLLRGFAEYAEMLFDLDVAIRDPLLVLTISWQRLPERKEVLGTVVSHQGLCNRFRAGCYFRVARFGEFSRIPFSRQNGVHDRQTGNPGDITDDVMELDVHLIESLLHVLAVNRGHLYQRFAMAPDRTHGADGLRRTMRCPKKANGMQILQPLAIRDIALPAGYVFLPGEH
jgi:hypothetical protein